MIKKCELISLLIFSSLPHLFTLHGDFVFDDSEAIVKNKDVSSESWINLYSNDFWGTDLKSNISHKSYRPLTVTTFRLNYILNGRTLSALYFKITNLICHVICTLLVWRTFKIILKNVMFKYLKRYKHTDYLAALMFAVHPVHTEAVCGIVGRADILAAITFFLAFIAYSRAIFSNYRYSLYLSLTITLSAISMLCKENGITVLGFCLCYDVLARIKGFCKSKKDISKRRFQRKSTKRMVYLVIAIGILLLARWVVMGGVTPVFKPTDNPAAFSDFNTKVFTYSYIYFLNILLFIWPQWLCYDWSMGCVALIRSALDYRVLFISMFYIYIILVLAILFKRIHIRSQRLVMIAVLLTIIPYLPASNIFYPVGFVIAERILYISSAGYCFLIAIGLVRLIHFKRQFKIHLYVLYGFLILVYSVRSWHRSFEWQTEYKLFVSALSVCPMNAKVHYNVAKVADAKQHIEWATFEYKEAIRLYPEYYQAMNNLANLLKNQKQYGEAEFYLTSAISYKKDFPAAWMNLGIVLANLRRYNESEMAYRTALEYRKNYPDCLYNLGNLYLEINEIEEAIDHWLLAINLSDTHTLAWTNLLALLDNTGQLDKSLELIPTVLGKLSESPAINFAVANIYGKLERYAEAETHFQRAIQLFGSKVQAIHYANFGVLYHRWGKYDLAETMYEKSIKIDPKFKSALKNLHSLKKLKNTGNK